MYDLHQWNSNFVSSLWIIFCTSWITGSVHPQRTAWYLLLCARPRKIFSRWHFATTGLWFRSVCSAVLAQDRFAMLSVGARIWRPRCLEVRYRSWPQTNVKALVESQLTQKREKHRQPWSVLVRADPTPNVLHSYTSVFLKTSFRGSSICV